MGFFGWLRTALRATPPFADDLEIEEEMLDGLRQLLELERELRASHLPRVETSHRVVGSDRCHFSAPVSMPDDPAQPTGRLLLTSTRAAFRRRRPHAGATLARDARGHPVRPRPDAGVPERAGARRSSLSLHLVHRGALRRGDRASSDDSLPPKRWTRQGPARRRTTIIGGCLSDSASNACSTARIAR